MVAAEWFKRLKSTPEQDYFVFLKQTLEQEFSVEFTHEAGLIDFIITVFDYLIRQRQFGQILELQELVHKKSQVLGEDRYYADSFAIDVHFFNNHPAGVERSLESFIDNPVQSIDFLIPIVDKLKYYGYGEMAYTLAKAVFYTCRNSDKLLAGAEDDFAMVIFATKMENLYNAYREGTAISKENFISELNAYHFENDELLEQIYQSLQTDNSFIDVDYSLYRQDPAAFSYTLLCGFLRFALSKNINFATSYDIWCGAWEVMHQDSDDKGGLDEVLGLNLNKFKDYIFDRLSFMSTKKESAVALIWGIQYVYDFLQKHQLINEEVYTEGKSYINLTKMELIDAFQSKCWIFSFVHSWDRPDGVTEEEFELEKKFFHCTYLQEASARDYLPEEYFIQKEGQEKARRNSNTVVKTNKVGRNSLCPCGSGKKYKKCCGYRA